MNDHITIPLPRTEPASPHRPVARQTLADSGTFAALQQLEAALAAESARTSRLARQLRAARTRIQELAGQVVAVQEDERLRIARELHDEAGQAMTALKLSLAALRSRLDDPDRAGAMLDDLMGLTDRTSDQIRRMAHDLRPCALDRYPLETVLEEVCREFARRTGLEIEFSGAVPQLPDSARISFYRFLQETLTNAARHAGANRIVVHLAEWDGLAVLSVTDDGFGFAEAEEGVGITGLRERFDLLGGWIEIYSLPGKGTCVQAGVPYQDTEAK